jgi:hypothetical protein
VGGKIARLLGAQPDEVIVADSTSVNLYKLATAALRARPDRTRILTDDANFPSDLYILQGVAAQAGPAHRLEVLPSPDGVQGPTHALMAALGSDVALLTLSHTLYKSAYTYDMAALTAAADGFPALLRPGKIFALAGGLPERFLDSARHHGIGHQARANADQPEQQKARRIGGRRRPFDALPEKVQLPRVDHREEDRLGDAGGDERRPEYPDHVFHVVSMFLLVGKDPHP